MKRRAGNAPSPPRANSCTTAIGSRSGNIRRRAPHCPARAPPFLITDGAAADRPIAAATGDFLFVGDVGRPDLLEKAAKILGTMEAGARTLWRSLRAFDAQEDWLQIWPGHGAGSACGKGISAIPYSTLGYERRFNWAFGVKTEDEFVARVLEGQPDPPAYFATMKALNKRGPDLRRTTLPPRLDGDRLLPLVRRAPASSTRLRDVAAGSARHAPIRPALVRDVGRLATGDDLCSSRDATMRP
jgi:hydroxyacylglutathione hydrolase